MYVCIKIDEYLHVYFWYNKLEQNHAIANPKRSMCLHMCWQWTSLWKCFITNVTRVRFFPCMNPQMNFQRWRLIKTFLTNTTNVITITCKVNYLNKKRFAVIKFTCVSFNVNAKIFTAWKRFWTHITLVGFFPGVYSHVFF